jgi:hypothetical protein
MVAMAVTGERTVVEGTETVEWTETVVWETVEWVQVRMTNASIAVELDIGKQKNSTLDTGTQTTGQQETKGSGYGRNLHFLKWCKRCRIID